MHHQRVSDPLNADVLLEHVLCGVVGADSEVPEPTANRMFLGAVS